MIGVTAFYSLLYILEFGHRLLTWAKVIDRTDISTNSLLSLFANTNLLVLLSTIKIKAHILINKLISEILDSFSSVQFSSSGMSNSLWSHGLQHPRPPCLLPTPRVYLNSCPLSQWCYPPSHPLSSPSPPAFNLSQHQGIFKWVSFSHQVAKILELQLQYQSL